jgi:hypothetical protein
MSEKRYTEQDLDNLIDQVLDNEMQCDNYPNVCSLMNSQDGRTRVFDAVKNTVIREGITDIQAALTQLELQFYETED